MPTLAFNVFTGTFDYVGTTGGGSGTVTSVGLSLPAEFTVTVSPITGAGTLTAVWATEAAATVFAGPVSGPNAVPTFRALVATDIPSLPYIPTSALPFDHHADLTNFTANDDHTQYLLLAGRTGTANDALLSTTTDGSLVGSSIAHGALRLNSGTPTEPGPTVFSDAWSTTSPVLSQDPIDTLEFFHVGRRDTTPVLLGLSQGLIPGQDTVVVGFYTHATAFVLGANGGTPHGGANYRFVDIGTTGAPATWSASPDGDATFDHFGLSLTRNLVSTDARLTLSFWTALYDHSTYGGTFDPGGINTTVMERRFIDDEPTIFADSSMVQRIGYSYGPAHGTGVLNSSLMLHCADQTVPNNIVTGEATAFRSDLMAQSAGNKVALRFLGDAPSLHVGTFRFGDATIAVEPVEIVGNLLLDNAGTAAELRFREPSGSGTNYTAFKAQAQAGDITYTLPATDAAGALTSNGSGALSWVAPSGLSIAGDVTGTLAATTVVKINGVAYNADPLAQYVKIAGRTGTGNDFTLSTTTNGQIFGSTLVNQHLYLTANSADGTNQSILSLEGGASGRLSLQVGPTGTVNLIRIGGTGLARWSDGAGKFVGLVGPSGIGADQDYTLPAAAPASTGDVLTGTAANPSVLSWAARSGFAIAGDVTGTLAATTVGKINGVAYNADPLAQYLYLPGRGADQTLVGDRLVLAGTGQQVAIWDATRTITAANIFEPIKVAGTLNLNTGQAHIQRSFFTQNTFNVNDNSTGLSALLTLESTDVVRLLTNGITAQQYCCLQNEAGYFANAGAGTAVTGSAMSTLNDFSTITATTGALTVTDWIGVRILGSMVATAAAATSTVTTRRGLWISQPGVSGAGTCAITTNIGLDIDAMTLGTTKIAIRSQDTGAATMISGPTRLGDQTTPTEKLEVLGNAIVTGHQTLESGLTAIGNATENGLAMAPTMSLTDAAAIFAALDIAGTWTNTVDPVNNSLGLNLHPTITCSGAGALDIVSGLNGVKHAPVYTTATANSIVLADRGVLHTPQFSKTSSGTWAASACYSVDSVLTVDTGLTLAGRSGMRFNAHVGGGAVTTDIAIQVGALTGATSIGLDCGAFTGATLCAAVRSAITASAGKRYFLRDTGGADSVIKGQVRIGDTTDPTAMLDLIGKLTVDTNGVVTRYQNVATAGRGIPAIVAVIDLTTQGAAGTGVALWTPATAGLYRISVALTLTRAGTTSTLGGAGGVKINYTTGDGATAKNQQVVFLLPGSTTATVINSATNTVGDTLIGALVIYSSTTAVTYDVGYTSSGGTAMQYALRIRVEAI